VRQCIQTPSTNKNLSKCTGGENIPRNDGTGPSRNSTGPRDGRGKGKGRGGQGIGGKTGGNKGGC
jgi:hypothetical protein